MVTFPVARYAFEVELINELRLGPYSGSALRGAFGWQLRRLTCITRMPDCAGCSLRSTCPYATIFEPEPQPKQATPLPYVIEPPISSEQSLSAGKLFRFNMVLIGPAVAQLALIILVWEKVFARGLSRKGHGQGKLARVVHFDQQGQKRVVYGDGEQGWYEQVQPHNTQLQLQKLHNQSSKPNEINYIGTGESREENTAPALVSGNFHSVVNLNDNESRKDDQTPFKSLSIEVITPLRLKHQGAKVKPKHFTAEAFIQAAVRRFIQLDKIYLHSQHLPPRVESSADLAVTKCDLTWMDWTRYSNRQKNYMQLGGLIGHLKLEGENLNLFYPYLYLGQFWHLGKNTSFGLGNYKLTEIA